MYKFSRYFFSFLLIGSLFLSCEKDTDDPEGCQAENGVCLEDHSCCTGITSNDGLQARLAYTEKGYAEVETTPIMKINCYFCDWDKEVQTPVSGLFEYYDTDGNWVASINFGDGTCDEWVTKTWDVNVFPEYPSGEKDFSVFDYNSKK